MSKKIAVCIDAFAFQANRIFDKRWAAKFPGAEAMPVLADLVREYGLGIVTGDVAISHVRSDYWDAKDVIVVQDMDSPDGLELIRLGATGKVLTAMESPIFAYQFYDRLSELAQKFEHRVLFKGAFNAFTAPNGHNHTAHFPGFHQDRIPPLLPWNERKFMVMVVGNNYWNRSARFPLSLSPKRYVKWLRKYKSRKNSPTLKHAIKDELQSKRLEAIEYFGSLGKLSLFGARWDDLSRLPKNWQKRLGNLISKMKPGRCENKVNTISSYKFAVCFENVAYPGYVTEKIIDCFVAGVIPVYMGAPDISDFVPKEAFVDFREFGSWQELDSFIENFAQGQAMNMINVGRDFLRSGHGQKHSFEGFAWFLFDLIL